MEEPRSEISPRHQLTIPSTSSSFSASQLLVFPSMNFPVRVQLQLHKMEDYCPEVPLFSFQQPTVPPRQPLHFPEPALRNPSTGSAGSKLQEDHDHHPKLLSIHLLPTESPVAKVHTAMMNVSTCSDHQTAQSLHFQVVHHAKCHYRLQKVEMMVRVLVSIIRRVCFKVCSQNFS